MVWLCGVVPYMGYMVVRVKTAHTGTPGVSDGRGKGKAGWGVMPSGTNLMTDLAPKVLNPIFICALTSGKDMG